MITLMMWNVNTNRSGYLEPHHIMLTVLLWLHTHLIRIHFQSVNVLVLSGIDQLPGTSTLDKLRILKNFVSIGQPKKSELC